MTREPRKVLTVASTAALAVGGLLGGYLGALRPTVSYASTMRNGIGCSDPGAIAVSTSAELDAAFDAARSGDVICMTNDITLTAGTAPRIVDTSVTFDGGGYELSWPSGQAGLEFDLSGLSEEEVTVRNLSIVDQRVNSGGAIRVRGDSVFGGDRLTMTSVFFGGISQESLPPGSNWIGGAVRVQSLSRVEMANIFVRDSLLQGNGAIYVSAADIGIYQSSLHGNVSYANLRDRNERATCDQDEFGRSDGPVGAAATLRAANQIIIADTLMWNNTSECDGGALWLSQSASRGDLNTAVTIRNSHLAFDTSRSGSGGGIAGFRLGQFNLLDTAVVRGQAKATGGGVDLRDVDDVFIQDSGITFSLTEESDGGGLHSYAPTADSTLSILDSIFLQNSADYSGGGLWVSAGDVTISGSQVMDNTAVRGDGGGIYGLEPDGVVPEARSSIQVRGTSITGNSADSGIGGGIRSITVNRTTSIANSTVYDNHARVAGGIQTPSGKLTIGLSTVVSNTADQDAGAGIFIAEGIASLLDNLIAWGNAGPSGAGGAGADVYSAGGEGSPAIIRNIIHTSAESISRAATENGIVADPLLTSLGDNGGPTPNPFLPMQTLAPRQGSPAIAAGGVTAFDTDQTDRPRNLASPTIGAVENAVRPASAPQNVGAIAGNEQAEVSWEPPADDGDTAISGYVIERSVNGGADWQEVTTAAATTRAVIVPDLVSGTAYVFRVAAVNAVGTGTFSAPTASVTPAPAVLAAPTRPRGVPSDRSVALEWGSPVGAAVAGIDGYRIQASDDNGVTWQTVIADSGSALTRATIPGLTNGTAYVFRVAAMNNAGIGEYSTTSDPVEPTASLPSAPGRPVANAGDALVNLSWSVPVTAGDRPISGYRVEASTDGVTWTPVVADTGSVATTAVIAGLSNGTGYAFRVTALTDAGESPPSATSNEVIPQAPFVPPPPVPPVPPVPVPPQPPGPPPSILPSVRLPGNVASPPRDVTAVALPGAATVSWQEPTSSGSYSVTHYWVTAEQGGYGCLAVAPATTCTVNNLVDGTEYTFTVEALNASGWSPESEPSEVVTPPGDSDIDIEGSRGKVRGKRGLIVTGETIGLAPGTVLKPFYKFRGMVAYQEGIARIVVQEDGSIRWQRRGNKRAFVYIALPDRSVRSERITIEPAPKRR